MNMLVTLSVRNPVRESGAHLESTQTTKAGAPPAGMTSVGAVQAYYYPLPLV